MILDFRLDILSPRTLRKVLSFSKYSLINYDLVRENSTISSTYLKLIGLTSSSYSFVFFSIAFLGL
jgi:hypothetical protein